MNQNLDIEIYRGDRRVLEFFYPGDITEDRIKFVVKADRNLTTARLIEKVNGDGGIDIESSGIYTKISVYLEPADTQALDSADYYYDIIREDPQNSIDYETIYYGLFSVNADVQNPYD